MLQNRNAFCNCGSGLKIKNCCGSLKAKPPVPISNILPLKNSISHNNMLPFDNLVFRLLEKGNIPQAEKYLRILLAKEPNNSSALNFIGWISCALGLYEMAIIYFERARRSLAQWSLPVENIKIIKKHLEGSDLNENFIGPKNNIDKYILIRAWGCGFWSDVFHVIGCLLIAEISGRVPIVYWGENSLFTGNTDENAFSCYFEEFYNLGVDDIRCKNFSYYPPKWNADNLKSKELNLWHGPYSRVAGMYLLNRKENVVIGDFYVDVEDVIPWINPANHLFDLGKDEIYRYIIGKYLQPSATVKDRVDVFLNKNFDDRNFIAVHIRGSDKAVEVSNFKQSLYELNGDYKKLIDNEVSLDPCLKIFLMTDDINILDEYFGYYGDRIVFTDCTRTNDLQGVHYKPLSDKVNLGLEVMTDVYIASNAKIFLGNEFSNVSRIVRYLKNWPDKNLRLLGGEGHVNLLIHDW